MTWNRRRTWPNSNPGRSTTIIRPAARRCLPARNAAAPCGSLHEHEPLRYRCRVGHAYSADSLLAEQSQGLEAALWTALRALEEQAALARRMTDRASTRGRGVSTDAYRRTGGRGRDPRRGDPPRAPDPPTRPVHCDVEPSTGASIHVGNQLDPGGEWAAGLIAASKHESVICEYHSVREHGCGAKPRSSASHILGNV